MDSNEGESGNISRDFWMPDESCRVCYECDSAFTVFNRKHHCRLCGRVFCGRCTLNTVPALPDEPKSGREDRDRIKVCNYCFKQWKQQVATGSNVVQSSPGITPSPSSSSLVSSQSSCCTCNSGSSAGSTEFSTGPFQHVSCAVSRSPHSSAGMDSKSPKQDQARSPEKLDYIDSMDPFGHRLGSCSRSDDEDDDYPVHEPDSEINIVSPDMGYGTNSYCQIDHIYGPCEAESNEESTHPDYNSALVPENLETQGSLDYKTSTEADTQNNDVQFGLAPPHAMDDADVEAVDYENNGLIWLPPEPEDEEDEREVFVSDDDDDDPGEDATGEWGYLRSSSFVVGELRNRDRSNEEHRRAMKRVVDGHFTALISQLLQAENFPASDYESWLEIITHLCWEAATLLKPDTSRGGGMDPGGYVKVKCIACGNRSESSVIKGIVCKKNVAHRRMSSKIDKARLLLLGGALEYQRVANHLSSFDTLLQQEMDHLKMAVAKIDAHHPNVLLVEKSVSRYAQEYLLAKNISLVLNIKRPLLERIARCSGAQIVPSIDSLSTPKLGYCDSFRVEKFIENLGSAGQGGKKLTKTLMFFEGCPRPLGCTILLKGASGDELKRVKHVVHYGVFAAYHLALETSFLADEGASLPELPLKSPIKVALPDKPSSVDRSISMIPGYNSPSTEKPQAQQQPTNAVQSRNDLSLDSRRSLVVSMSVAEPVFSKGSTAQIPSAESRIRNVDNITSGADISGSQWEQLSDSPYSMEGNRLDANGYFDAKQLTNLERNYTLNSEHLFEDEALGQGFNFSPGDANRLPLNMDKSESVLSGQHGKDYSGESETLRDEFPPSPSDHQSILVSLSTRCVLKGIVCERAHLFRIKYYGNFDKPLGRFLRDHLFDQGSRCSSCEMPSEAHVHCYTHQQGSLTISVKKLQESLLPGEKEGKIWMWHRCLRCPRTNGFPPSTKRVVMSDAAWGLSFGKFLELSFSNHAAASRVASCGHSLHRDCLRFYGFGRMVACFRYAPINVHSVYLPPSMLEFNYYKEEWIQKDFEEVSSMAYVFITEVQDVLHHISDRVEDDSGEKTDECRKLLAELELMLQKEIKEFEESLWYVLKKEVKHGQPDMDILEINRIKRQLVFHAYVWDQRLMQLSKYKVGTLKEKPANIREKRSEVDTISRFTRGFTSLDSSFANMMPYLMPNEGEESRITRPDEIHKGMDIDQPSRNKEDPNLYQPSDRNLSNQSDIPECNKTVRRARSEGQFPVMENTLDNLDTAWTGNQQSERVYSEDKKTNTPNTFLQDSSGAFSVTNPLRSGLPAKGPNDIENPKSWLGIPFLALYRSIFNKNTPTTLQRLGKIAEYSPAYISSFRDLVHLGGARLLLPTADSDIVVPIYDDEPTSVISYTLVSPEYHNFMSAEPDKQKSYLQSSSSFSLLDPMNIFSFSSFDELSSESMKGPGSADESILSSGSRSFSGLDSLLYPSTMHSRISFTDDSPPGKVKYTVTCYFAKQFEALRKDCCSSELDFIRSLSRCKKWGAQGGKSNVFFAKTLDDRFIIKQVTKTELESFIKFAPSYFKYLSESISIGCPTCLAKILGIYQVTSKHLKGGKETRMDVLVMENLLYRRNITRLYDLKGSARSRYNPDSSGSNKVLLDQNLIEAMPTSPIFLGTKAKRLLERAVWNDTAFLASIDVMDYSLLVGIDEEKHELVVGIIDFMRQYTWDKHLETWVKASGILGGPKNASPTIISPIQYKKRFRKAMSAYFLMVPDQWLSSTILPSSSQREESSQDKVTIQ